MMQASAQPIAWKPNAGPQTEALQRSEFEVLYGGARGGGKTDAGLAWLMRDIGHPRYRFLVVRRNAEDLSDWLDRARLFFAPAGGEIVGKPPVIRFPSGATGKVGHLKDESAFDKYLGHEYHRILIEELTLISKEDRYLKLMSSARSTVPELRPRIFATTNPGGAGHVWVKNRFVVNGSFKPFIDPKSGRSRIFIPAKLSDNPPLAEGDPSYGLYLKSLPDKTRKAWLDGDWDSFEGQFFDSWNHEVHVCQPFDIPKEWNRYISLDYGYSAPSAVLWFAVSPDGRTYQYRELYTPGLTFEKLRDEVLYLSKGENIQSAHIDPALKGKSQGTGISGFEVLNSQNEINFVAADNDRLNGWTRLREYYRIRHDSDGRPYSWLTIFDTCRSTIRTVPELVHDSVRVEDVDTDGEDHAADAQRYFVMSRPVPAEMPVPSKYQSMRPQDATFWEYMNDIKKSAIQGDEEFYN